MTNTHHLNLTAREAGYISVIDDGDEFVIVRPRLSEDEQSPFGVPGDVLLGREEWGSCYIYPEECPQGPNGDVPFYRDTEDLDEDAEFYPAATMPDWAIRIRAVTREVRCVRVNDLTFDEMSKALMRELGDIGFADWFNREFPDIKALTNPYVWLGRFAKHSESKESPRG